MSATVERDPARTPRTRLARYGLWQLRDYLLDRGGPTLIISVLLGYLTVAPGLARLHVMQKSPPRGLIARHGSAALANAAMVKDFNQGIVAGLLGALVFLGALMAMNGIVANDRKSGHYRFLFSKPVSPSRYYGQAFAIHFAGYLLVVVALNGLYSLALPSLLTGPRLAVVALLFLCYAGIAFLLSAAARWDWLSLVAVSIAAKYFWDRYGESTNPAAGLLYLLPPLHKTDEIYRAAAMELPLPWHSLQWLAGYGLVCFVAALVVLRFRRLAIV